VSFYNKVSYLDVNLKNTKVILRLDFSNCIFNGEIYDEYKFFSNIDSIKEILKSNPLLVIFYSINNDDDNSELAKKIEKFINLPVDEIFSLKEIKFNSKNILLFNCIFLQEDYHKENEELSKQIAMLIDLFIFDSIALVNLKNVSTYGISKFCHSVIGPIVKRELDNINRFISMQQEKIYICGLERMFNKLSYIQNMFNITTNVFFADGCSLTFLKSLNKNIGKSFFEEEIIKDIVKIQNNFFKKILLPKDFHSIEKFNQNELKNIEVDTNKNDSIYMLDIGDETLLNIKKKCSSSKAILLEGVLGMIELPLFQQQTNDLLQFLKTLSKDKDIFVFLCGNTLVNFLRHNKFNCNDFSYVSHAEKKIINLFLKKDIHCLTIIEDNIL
jgi:phosphoglycerate kinase